MSSVGGPLTHFVSGAAPECRLSPLRVSRSVIHLSYGNLTRALDFASEQDQHVVSMSLGGPLPSGVLERAVRRATSAGLILVAAAGNYWPVVTYPGALDDVVTVGACNCADGIWQFSSPGPEVDVAAPGESVWVARSVHDQPPSVEQGSGSSFGTPMVAGIAALWLSHHGRDALIARYGRPGVSRVFRHLLVTAGVRVPAGWDTARHGAGIVDAHALLVAALPAAVPAPLARFAAAPPAGVAASGAAPRALAAIAHAVPDLDAASLRVAVARVLHVSEPELDAALAEVGHELAVHASADPAVRDALRAASPVPPPPAAASGARRARPRARAAVPSSAHLRRAGSPRLLRMMRGGR
jgi:serine protease